MDWKTAEISEVGKVRLLIKTPSIYHKKQHVQIESSSDIVLFKVLGYGFAPFKFKDGSKIVFEVLGIYDDFTIIGIGYTRG